jgi:hypothetical protein
MSISAQIRKLEQYELKHRSGIERTATIVLTMIALFSMSELGHVGNREDKRNLAARGHDVIAQRSVVFNPAEKNETVRMPVKFDDGLRATATSSS